jgi:hypothetical protein
MGIFGLGKKRGFVDLGERYRQQQERAEQISQDTETESKSDIETPVASGFGFLGGLAGAGSSSSENEESNEYVDISSDVGEKKKRLAKRFMEMTEKTEELSNQIYHLQQRIEVLEKKSGVSGF